MLRQMLKKALGRVWGGAMRVTQPPPPAPPTPPEPVAPAESMASIEEDPQEVRERVDAGEPVTLVDVRTPGEVAAGTIPGALHIPLDALAARWQELESCNEVVCFCASGRRSLQAAEFLRQKGIFNATSMAGGIQAWRDQRGPVTGASA